MAPWRWMGDSQLVGVKDPRTGVTGWCVVMGLLGQVYGIALCLGDRGYSHLSEVLAGGMRPFSDLAVEMDALFLHLISREEVPSEDWPSLKAGGMSAGVRIGRRTAWPWARRVEPWRYPRVLTGEECEQLSQALDQVVHIAERLQADPKMLLRRRSGAILVRVYDEAQDGGGWHDTWESPKPYVAPEVWAESDVERIEGILERSDRTDATWDVDAFPMTSPIQDGDVQYYPRAVVLMDSRTTRVLHVGIIKPDEQDWTAVMNVVLDGISAASELPSVIRVRNRNLYELFKTLRTRLDIRIRLVDSMPQMDSVIAGMLEWMKRGPQGGSR